MAAPACPESLIERVALTLRGAVQGVGFRPFVYRLARDLSLSGWVCNSSQGVHIEVEGECAALEAFLARLQSERPPHSTVWSQESRVLDPAGFVRFEIRESPDAGEVSAVILPDLATCEACREEIFDSRSRRYRYPFTNCTHCGPRYSIMTGLPYDRAQTSMRGFSMCPDCRAEYEDPEDRRFHAQPIACPKCGPRLRASDATGVWLADGHEALLRAASVIADGGIVALKGLGGYQLIVDAGDDAAVERLRVRKNREAKPFAVMLEGIEEARRLCEVSVLEERVLRSAEAPIVLLQRRVAVEGANSEPGAVSGLVAPDHPQLGVMLPYTPLHHLLLAAVRRPIVATSGNRAEEPICIEASEALDRLGAIADLFLGHDRPVVRPVDDSVVRWVAGREQVLRRARGFAPLPVPLPGVPEGILAVGGHLKNVVAISRNDQVILSQHVGDLENLETVRAFRGAIEGLRTLYRGGFREVVADAHPDYASSRYAEASGLPVTRIQHHHAHVAACMAENEIGAPALGVSWDGTGYGPDGTIWGGEFFDVQDKGFERVAAMRPFPLQGNEYAVREPRRAALGLLWTLGDCRLPPPDTVRDAFTGEERSTLCRALDRGLNAPFTSSVGRLFDGVASIVGLRQVSRYEGDAATTLEFAATRAFADAGRIDGERVRTYPFHLVPRAELTDTDATPALWKTPASLVEAPRWLLDWAPMIRGILDDLRDAVPVGHIALCFHLTLVEMILAVARETAQKRVVLSGGCFQNRLLTELACAALGRAGLRVYRHQRVPPNDGGIALGQIAALAMARRWGRRAHVSGRAGQDRLDADR